jgi:transglutaminase-like putative cysteine protease
MANLDNTYIDNEYVELMPDKSLRTISVTACMSVWITLILASYPYILTLGLSFSILVFISFLLVLFYWISLVQGYSVAFLSDDMARKTIKIISIVLLLSAAFLFSRRYGWQHPLTINGLVLLVAWLKFCDGLPHRDATAILLISTVVFSETIMSGYHSLVYLMACLLSILISLLTLNDKNTSLLSSRFWRLFLRLWGMSLPFLLICYLFFPRLSGTLFDWQLENGNGWFSTQASSFEDEGQLQTSATGKKQAALAQSETFNLDDLSHLSKTDRRMFTVGFDKDIPSMSLLYWRGAVLWDYDGTTWHQRKNWQQEDYIGNPIRGDYLRVNYTMRLPAHGKRWLYALDFPLYRPLGASFTRDHQLIAENRLSEPFTYKAGSILVDAYKRRLGVSGHNKETALALSYPKNSNPKLQKFGRLMKGQNTQRVVKKILRRFSSDNFSYDQDRFPLAGRNSLDDFMFSSKVGQCGHYASAFVLAMRAAGIPARLVTGFRGGRKVKGHDNDLEITAMMAHAWAEYWTGEYWQRIDPTLSVSGQSIANIPATGKQYDDAPTENNDSADVNVGYFESLYKQASDTVELLLFNYNYQIQRNLLLYFNSIKVPLFFSVIFLMLVSFIVYVKFLRVNKDNSELVFDELVGQLSKAGLHKKTSEGAKTYIARACEKFPDSASDISIIGSQIVRARYARDGDEVDFKALRKRIRALIL